MNLLLLLFFLITYAMALPCEQMTLCTGCVTNFSCGWCADTTSCVEGKESGPFSPSSCNNWFYATSQVTLQTEGFPVSPVYYEVFLRPDSPLTIPITVRPPENDRIKLDLFFLQDASNSYRDDKITWMSLVPKLINEVIAYNKDSWFGLGTFEEKPLAPMGVPDDFLWDNGVLFSSDYEPLHMNWEYRREVKLTRDFNAMIQGINNLQNNGNFDTPETSLSALYYSANCVGDTGWREGSRRVVVLSTDAPWHQQNDTQLISSPCANTLCKESLWTAGINPSDVEGYWCHYCETCSGSWSSSSHDHCDSNCYSSSLKERFTAHNTSSCPFVLPPQNGDCVLDGSTWGGPGSGEDYPSIEDTRNALRLANVVPLFAVTSDVVSEYTSLRDELGFGSVSTLSDDSNNLIPLLLAALEEFASTITLVTTLDPQGYVANFTPSKFTNASQFVPYTFNLTLHSTGAVVPNTILMTAIGFGRTYIDIISSLPCRGCDGVSNSNTIVDHCQVCGGSDECVGCDDVPFSGKEYDLCGVCGGSNDCVGCDGVPLSGKMMDDCGVCGGSNACYGCDGVPLSGKNYDACGVCGGSNDCLDCAFTPFGTKSLDACGVCGGSNTCLGCDGIPFSGKMLDQCGECGGLNTCPFDCFNIPYGTAVVDGCEVCDGDGSSCVDCMGVAFGSTSYDSCGVCGGTDNCLDCTGKPLGTKVVDACGVCGGSNITCKDCEGNFNGSKSYDLCGVCGGNNTCLDCAGEPFGKHILKCELCLAPEEAAAKQCQKVEFTTTANITVPTQESESSESPILQDTTVIAVGASAGVALLFVAGAVMAFFIYKRITKGANWFVVAIARGVFIFFSLGTSPMPSWRIPLAK